MLVRLNQGLQNPNVCTICEEKPTGETVIDCERYTPDSPRYRLNGRKYVCQNCANEIAKKSGFTSEQDRLDLESERTYLGMRVSDLEKELKQFEDLRALISTVQPAPAKRPVGRPKKVVPSVDQA